MGCNCGGKAKTYTYEYTAPDGAKKVYRSEIEAQAAKIRNRGGSIRQVAAA